MRYRLIVKGPADRAESAARMHGFRSIKVESESIENDSTGLTAEGRPADVSDWFVEDHDDTPPYRHGSLLWYGEEKRHANG